MAGVFFKIKTTILSDMYHKQLKFFIIFFVSKREWFFVDSYISRLRVNTRITKGIFNFLIKIDDGKWIWQSTIIPKKITSIKKYG